MAFKCSFSNALPIVEAHFDKLLFLESLIWFVIWYVRCCCRGRQNCGRGYDMFIGTFTYAPPPRIRLIYVRIALLWLISYIASVLKEFDLSPLVGHLPVSKRLVPLFHCCLTLMFPIMGDSHRDLCLKKTCSDLYCGFGVKSFHCLSELSSSDFILFSRVCRRNCMIVFKCR